MNVSFVNHIMVNNKRSSVCSHGFFSFPFCLLNFWFCQSFCDNFQVLGCICLPDQNPQDFCFTNFDPLFQLL